MPFARFLTWPKVWLTLMTFFPRIVSLLLFNLELWCGASFDTVLSLLQGILSIDGVIPELSENEWITADLIDDPISSACYSALSVQDVLDSMSLLHTPADDMPFF